jgi:hypothetical protein
MLHSTVYARTPSGLKEEIHGANTPSRSGYVMCFTESSNPNSQMS